MRRLICAFVGPLWQNQIFSSCGSFMTVHNLRNLEWQPTTLTYMCSLHQRVFELRHDKTNKVSVRPAHFIGKQWHSCCFFSIGEQNWLNFKINKTNKISVCPSKTQISLGIHPVWSESSLCIQWIAKDPSFLHADCKDSDQTGRMPRLIWVFAGRTLSSLVLSNRSSCSDSYQILRMNIFYVPFIYT